MLQRGKIKHVTMGYGVSIEFEDGKIMLGKKLVKWPDLIEPDKEYAVVEGDFGLRIYTDEELVKHRLTG